MTDGQGPFISPNELVQKEMAPQTHVYFQLTKKCPRLPGLCLKDGTGLNPGKETHQQMERGFQARQELWVQPGLQERVLSLRSAQHHGRLSSVLLSGAKKS